MDRRIDSHRSLVSVFAGVFFVDVKQGSMALSDRFFPVPGERVAEIQVNAAAALSDAAAFIANFLGRPRIDVAWRQMPRAWRLPLEVIVALIFLNLTGRAFV